MTVSVRTTAGNLPSLSDTSLSDRRSMWTVSDNLVDTGAAVSILSESVFLKKFPEGKLESTSMVLRTYTGETMKVLGVFPASVRYQQQDPCDLELVIVAGDGPCLLGRSWLEEIHLDWYSIASMSKDRPNTALKRIARCVGLTPG